MGRGQPRVTLVPWIVEPSDLREAESGIFSRDVSIFGHAQRHLGLPVIGQFDPSLSLGMIAVRCERSGSALIPMTIALADTPPTGERTPAMDMRLLSGPVRAIDNTDKEQD